MQVPLKKMKITQDNLCRICKNKPETLKHLFVECQTSSLIWLNLQKWIKNKTNHEIDFTPQTIILGYLMKNNLQIPINTIILVSKSYIFWCTIKNKNPNIFELQKRIKQTYIAELSLANLNFGLSQFTKTWHQISPIFQNIQIKLFYL